jgi:thioesterase domain-containing protein
MIEVKSIQLLAARYIKSIRSIQQYGPYRIAGYSWSGILALEIAQQLQKSGQKVEILFLLDPYKLSRVNDGTQTIITANARFLMRKKAQYLRFQSKVVDSGGPKGLLLSLLTLKRLKRIVGVPWLTYHLFHLGRSHPNILSEKFLPRNMWPIFWYDARRKVTEYIAELYPGASITIFTPEQSGQDDWAKILGNGNEVVHMPVDHGQFFEPNVAREWQDQLRKGLSD